ncbi:MAG: hypothetical protein HYX34_13420 [Actinobacteria bacterium]|nr:hypothetical protein [Actinomycetota bacterium]
MTTDFDPDKAQQKLDELGRQIEDRRHEAEHDPDLGFHREDPAWLEDDHPDEDQQIAPPG